MAASNNERVDVAKVAYEAQSFEDFKAWLDSHPTKTTKKDKNGKVVSESEARRVLSWSANANADDEGERAFYDSMHSPVVRTYKSEGDAGYDADLALFTRYAIQFTLANDKKVDESIRSVLLADREARRQAQADRMSGLAGTNTVKAAQGSKAQSLIATLLKSGAIRAEDLSPEDLADAGIDLTELGLS